MQYILDQQIISWKEKKEKEKRHKEQIITKIYPV